MDNHSPLVDRLSDWKMYVLDRQCPCELEWLSVTTNLVYEVIDTFGPRAIDLRDLPVDRVNGIHLAVVLRCVSPWKDHVLGWDQAIGVAQSALIRDHISVDDAMYGLIPLPIACSNTNVPPSVFIWTL